MLFRSIFESATRHHIPVDIFAAMAVHESGLNPFAIGKYSEKGIFQLHPKGPGRGIQFVRDDVYWERCKRLDSACQKQVIDRAAKELERGLLRCRTLKKALGYYNTGKCDGDAVYVKRILYQRKRLIPQYQVAAAEVLGR